MLEKETNEESKEKLSSCCDAPIWEGFNSIEKKRLPFCGKCGLWLNNNKDCCNHIWDLTDSSDENCYEEFTCRKCGNKYTSSTW